MAQNMLSPPSLSLLVSPLSVALHGTHPDGHEPDKSSNSKCHSSPTQSILAVSGQMFQLMAKNSYARMCKHSSRGGERLTQTHHDAAEPTSRLHQPASYNGRTDNDLGTNMDGHACLQVSRWLG